MSNEIQEVEITRKQIMERLEQLGIEYDPNAKKAVLLDALNSAVESPEASSNETSSSDEPEQPSKAKSDTKDGSLGKSDLRRARRSNKDSMQIVTENAEAQDEKRVSRINNLLSQKGVDWYLAQARTILSDGRVCRRGYYYPVHKDEVARVGTYKHRTGKMDQNGVERIEIRPRFKKETPEQGRENLPAEEREQFDANEFVG